MTPQAIYELPSLPASAVRDLVGEDPPKDSVAWYIRNFVRAQGATNV